MSKHNIHQNIADVTISEAQIQYVHSYYEKLRNIKVVQVFILVFLIAGWEILSFFRIIDPFIFSSPSRVLKSFYNMSKDGSIFYHTGITLAETFLSFALVIIIGIFVAVLLWWNDTISKILEPYLVVLNSLPKSALAPVFIVWLGNNCKTIIIAAISVAVFGTIITLYTDFTGIEEDKIKLIYTLGGSKKDVLFKIVLPSNIPSIISTMKVNIGLSLVGVIIGEFLAAKAGLGYLIVYGSQVFKLDWVIMSICILCVVATALYHTLAVFERKFQ